MRSCTDQPHSDNHLISPIGSPGRAVASALVGHKHSHEDFVADVVPGQADNDRKGTGVENNGANGDRVAPAQSLYHAML